MLLVYLIPTIKSYLIPRFSPYRPCRTQLSPFILSAFVNRQTTSRTTSTTTTWIWTTRAMHANCDTWTQTPLPHNQNISYIVIMIVSDVCSQFLMECLPCINLWNVSRACVIRFVFLCITLYICRHILWFFCTIAFFCDKALLLNDATCDRWRG